MTDQYLIVDHLKFSYEGLFNVAELYNLITAFFFEKKWDWHEELNQELVTPKGKQVYIRLLPWKNVSDYHKLRVSIKMIFTDIKEVEVEHEGKTIKLNQGLVRIIFDGYIITDRKKLWTKPYQWFLTVIFDKYFYRNHLAKYETWIKNDIDDLLHKIKTFLNVYHYTYQQ